MKIDFISHSTLVLVCFTFLLYPVHGKCKAWSMISRAGTAKSKKSWDVPNVRSAKAFPAIQGIDSHIILTDQLICIAYMLYNYLQGIGRLALFTCSMGLVLLAFAIVSLYLSVWLSLSLCVSMSARVLLCVAVTVCACLCVSVCVVAVWQSAECT